MALIKIRDSTKKLILNSETIDACSEKVADFLKSINADKKDILRVRLSVEDILIKWLNYFGEGTAFRFSCFLYIGQPTVQLKLQGTSYDPLIEENEELDGWSKKLLASIQAAPFYSYSRDTNVVTFRLMRKSKSPLFWLLIALTAAAVVGLCGVFIPESVRTFVSGNILTPLCNTYLNVLNFFGIPLIFLSVLLGVCGVGDAATFGRIGKKMIGHFALSLLIMTVLAVVIAYPLFDFQYGQTSASIDLGEFYTSALGFLPTSLITPFIDCNAMQLIIMGVVIGIAILKLNPITETISNVFDDLDRILVLISLWFTKLIPFFVFSMIVKSVWSGEILSVLSAWKSWVVTIGLQLLMLAVMGGQICLKQKIKPFILIKKVISTFLISLGTNSCSATIPEMFDCASKLGIEDNMAGVGISIGTSVFKPSTAIRFVVLSYFMAIAYDVPVSFSWFIMVAIMGLVLSIAVPAIPGGALLFCPMLFAQVGIPAEAITAMLATDIFFDAPCTAFCMVSTEFAMIQQADKLGLLNKDTLKKI